MSTMTTFAYCKHCVTRILWLGPKKGWIHEAGHVQCGFTPSASPEPGTLYAGPVPE